MRNLKKILALVLALMMVLSVMVFASAANYDDYSDKDQVSPEYAEAVEVLTGMDIFWGSENSFYPKSNVTRAEVATLLYRIMTGDITGSQVGIYKDYGMFDDVLETNWFAGYVNYAANGELVVGVGDNKYNPKGNVTGYEWITMLLRAIGYDANGEISGSTWKITAASQAKESGILGSFNEATLNSALTREQVAYLLFNAIQARKVNYTNAFGYRPSSLGYTIAWDMFRLAKTDTISIDAWGRPGYVWYGESSNTANYNSTADTLYATMEEAPVKTYNTAVTECDVASDAGISSRKTYDVYTNGVYEEDGQEVVATDTVNTVGAQGRLTEVYGDRIVMITTYLAQVVDVNETETDDAGHVITKANSELNVWRTTKNFASSMVMDSTDYSVGSYILVNYNEANKTVYDVQEAEAVVGTQTRIWQNAERHTVNGTDYYDAEKFLKDAAQNDQTYRFTWFLDQYGNVIGSAEISRNSYAVLKDLIWIDGTPGYARATLINMDGTEYTATVSFIDGDDTSAAANSYKFDGWDRTNYVPHLADAYNIGFDGSNANVSSNSNYNNLYLGYALYKVYTYDGGNVSLEGLNEISYLDEATVDTTTSAILADTDNDGNVDVRVPVDNNTQFIVRTGTLASGYTYTAYNRNTLPASLRENVEVFYNDLDVSTFADYVYIKSYVPATLDGTHLFVTGNEAWHEVGSGNQWQMTANLDGEEYTLTTTETIKNTLQANVGKLFHVDIDTTAGNTYGQITDVDLVNELTDNTANCNYLSGGLNIRLNGNVLQGDGVSYDVEDAVIVSTKSDVTSVADLEKAIEKGYGIWVLVDHAASPYEHAAVVYVGEKLSDNTGIAVTLTNGTKTYTAKLDADGDGYTVVLPEDEALDADATWTIDADHDNARLTVDPNAVGDCVTPGTSFLLNYKNSDTRDQSSTTRITVYSEVGTVSKQYSLTVETTDEVLEDVITVVGNLNVNTDQFLTNVDGYYSFDGALNHVNSLDKKDATKLALTANGTLVITNSNEQYPVKAVLFTSSTLATEANMNQQIASNPTGTTLTFSQVESSNLYKTVYGVDITDVTNNHVLVIRFQEQKTAEYVYVAFSFDV